MVQVETTESSVVPIEYAVPEARSRQSSKPKPSAKRVHLAQVRTTQVLGVPPTPVARSAGGGGGSVEIVELRRELAYWDGCRMANSLSLMQYCHP